MLVEPQDQFNHSATVLESPPEFDSAHFDMFAKTRSNGFVDEIVFIHKGSGTQYPVKRDLLSAAFGQPMMTTFERIFGHDGSRLQTPERPKPLHPDDKRDILQPIQQMSYRPQGETTWRVVKTQDIIDRLIQYSIEEEMRMQDALEEILYAQLDHQEPSDDGLSISQDDIIISTGETFADFSARVGNDVRIEIVEGATDEDIRRGLDQAQTNRLDIEARANAKPEDARGLQGRLKEIFPKEKTPWGDALLKRIHGLSLPQAKLIEATCMAGVLAMTNPLDSSSILTVEYNGATVTSLAEVNADISSRSLENVEAAQDVEAEVQQCVSETTPAQMIDMRVELFKQSDFYQERINSPEYSRRSRAIWVELAANAVKEAWEVDSELFMRYGYDNEDALFTTELHVAFAESAGNLNKYNEGNRRVAGLYHISYVTANSVIEMFDLRDKYPDLFPDRDLEPSDLINARMSSILFAYISVSDYRGLSNQFGRNIDEVFPQYHPYIPHVNGQSTAARLIDAAIERPTKRDRATGERVLQTAVDIVGTEVARDNPSLYYRTVKIYRGEEVTTAFIATLPEEAARRVRERRVARSVDEAITELNRRGHNQEGIESLGHASPTELRSAVQSSCRLAIAA